MKLLVEEDDSETRAALAHMPPAAWIEVVVTPRGAPRTKPRALNVGLLLARGSLLVVYDAEDAPAPRQLRDAAARFAAAPARLACLQAALAIDNRADTAVSALFAIEYAALFDVLLRGLAALKLPLPLGGSSNHFRVASLRRVRGWDAWNVTEDVDVGLRLARFGYCSDILASTTYEEAPTTVPAWLKQRRRWLKGWMRPHC